MKAITVIKGAVLLFGASFTRVYINDRCSILKLSKLVCVDLDKKDKNHNACCITCMSGEIPLKQHCGSCVYLIVILVYQH